MNLIRAIGFIGALTIVSQLQAASAVAIGVDQAGKAAYSCWHDPRLSEAQVTRRALAMAQVATDRNMRVIVSTSKPGFGAIIMFLQANNTVSYTAALAAPTWDRAVAEAKKKAKKLGGRAFKVVRTWDDAFSQEPIEMEKL